MWPQPWVRPHVPIEVALSEALNVRPSETYDAKIPSWI